MNTMNVIVGALVVIVLCVGLGVMAGPMVEVGQTQDAIQVVELGQEIVIE